MRLGKYEVLGPIGIGGFGRVWLARDSESAQQSAPLVAIKRLRRARIRRTRSSEDIAKYEVAFKYEAEIGSHLVHPNVVRVIELAHVGKDYLLIMEFVNGLGLDELMGQRRQKDLAMPPDIALEIAIQAGTGLHYAHTACGPDGRPLHIVHRDIKPSNIMISRSGVVRVMDFGVARSALSRVQTTTGTIKGTLRYLSPEQAQGLREIGPAADQFALGLVLCEMLTGRPVYEAEHDHQILLKALRGQVATAIDEAERVCPGVGPLLTRALALAPEQRFVSVGELVEALKRVVPPLHALVGLSEWVHLGLEERARLAAEDPDTVRIPDSGGRYDMESLGASKVDGGSSEVHPLGWAHDQLAADETERAAGADLQVQRYVAQGDDGEESAPHRDSIAPAVAEAIEGPDGWAMMPSESDELDLNLLRRVPVSDGWSVPGSSAGGARKGRRRTELLAKARKGAPDSQVMRSPPSSPTAYNLNRPGHDPIRVKLKASAVSAGAPRVRMRTASSISRSGGDAEHTTQKITGRHASATSSSAKRAKFQVKSSELTAPRSSSGKTMPAHSRHAEVAQASSDASDSANDLVSAPVQPIAAPAPPGPDMSSPPSPGQVCEQKEQSGDGQGGLRGLLRRLMKTRQG